MKRVLWISYLYPPLFCGVGRQVKVAKYLPKHGWLPVVLTVKRSVFHPLMDESRMKDVPEDIEVHRTRSLESKALYRLGNSFRGTKRTSDGKRSVLPALPALLRPNPKWVCIPDQFVGWFPFALREGLRILRRQRVDAIFSTSLPNTCHLVGYALKRKSGLPWIADFRDLWTQNTYYPYTRLALAIENRMEAAVVRSADRITTINDPITKMIHDKYSDQPQGKFVTIPHGFDPDDFRDVRISLKSFPEKFTITYTGSLFAPRNVDTFMLALKETAEEDAEFAQKTEVRFIGKVESARILCAQLRLEGFVTFSDMVPHEEAWARLAASDVMLFVLGGRDPMDPMFSTGKLFEYLAIGRPILALAPDGEAARIIGKANAGTIVHPDDKEGIKEALRRMYRQWFSGNLMVQRNQEATAEYDITHLAGRFAAILDELAQERA